MGHKSLLTVGERTYRVFAALLFTFAGIYALVVQAWHWSGTLQHPQGILLSGWPKDLMAFAELSAAVSIGLPIAAHDDEANSGLYRVPWPCISRYGMDIIRGIFHLFRATVSSKMTPKTPLEEMPITPASFHCGFRLGVNHRPLYPTLARESTFSWFYRSIFRTGTSNENMKATTDERFTIRDCPISHMKFPQVLIFAALLLFATSAFARLGETREQIARRYGPGTRCSIQRLQGAETMVYHYDDFEVEVVFHNDKSIWEIFHPTRDIGTLLKPYADDGHTWHFNDTIHTWQRSGNPKYIADAWPGHEDYFCIEDVNAIEAIQDDNVNGTGGF